jgi:hypothetical protein
MRDLGLVALAEAEFRTPRPHPPDEWWNGFFVALLRQPPGPRRPPRMR